MQSIMHAYRPDMHKMAFTWPDLARYSLQSEALQAAWMYCSLHTQITAAAASALWTEKARKTYAAMHDQEKLAANPSFLVA